LRCIGDIGKYSKDFSNLPDRYIRRTMRQIYWKTPNAIQYMPRTVEKRTFKFNLARPWSTEFQNENRPDKFSKKVYVQPIKDWFVFRGDRVEVLVGKDKGKQGYVHYIVQERNWVLVEGLNCKYTIVGKSRDFPGTMYKEEQPLLITTEVALVDPADNKPTKIEWRYTEEGEKVRVSARTGRIIPIPIKAQETIDYKTKSTYTEQEKDTKPDALTEITFQPKVKTFEMDIMDEMGIVEDRIPKKTYWY